MDQDIPWKQCLQMSQPSKDFCQHPRPSFPKWTSLVLLNPSMIVSWAWLLAWNLDSVRRKMEQPEQLVRLVSSEMPDFELCGTGGYLSRRSQKDLLAARLRKRWTLGRHWESSIFLRIWKMKLNMYSQTCRADWKNFEKLPDSRNLLRLEPSRLTRAMPTASLLRDLWRLLGEWMIR